MELIVSFLERQGETGEFLIVTNDLGEFLEAHKWSNGIRRCVRGLVQ